GGIRRIKMPGVIRAFATIQQRTTGVTEYLVLLVRLAAGGAGHPFDNSLHLLSGAHNTLRGCGYGLHADRLGDRLNWRWFGRRGRRGWRGRNRASLPGT